MQWFNTMKIGLLGFGTVGGGVGAIVLERQEQLKQLLGSPVEVVAALVKDVSEHKHTPFEHIVTEDVSKVIDHPEVEVIFEALGGIELPFEWISRALKNKKHVITANKAVICAHFQRLKALARENNVTLSVEACVGGGIPIISTLSDHLLFGETTGIHGILNGTGNYILSKIEKEQVSFLDALSEAQALGYAEQVPDDDVDGFDASRKLLILTALIHNAYFTLDQVFIASIRGVRPSDFERLKAEGKTLRYVVSCELQPSGDALFLAARPCVVPITSPFGQTFGPDNTLVFEHSHLNQLSLKGPGAGKYPTANAMIGDLIRLPMQVASSRREPLAQNKQLVHHIEKHYYIRANDAAIEALKSSGFLPSDAQNDTQGHVVKTNRPWMLKNALSTHDSEGFLAEIL